MKNKAHLARILFTALLVTALLSPSLVLLASPLNAVIQGSVDPEIFVYSRIDCGKALVGKIYYWAGNGTLVSANINGPTEGAKPIITVKSKCNLTVVVLLWDIDAWTNYNPNYCPLCGTIVRTYKDKYEKCGCPGRGTYHQCAWLKKVITLDELQSKNLEAITLFFDRDTQFGNGNEVELRDFNPETAPFYVAWLHQVDRGRAGLWYDHDCVKKYIIPANYSMRVIAGKTWCASDPTVIASSSNPLNPGDVIYLVIRADSYGVEGLGGNWTMSLIFIASPVP